MTSPSRPPSILHLITSLTRAGAELQLLQLAVRLAERGCRQSVVCMTEPDGLVDELRAAGVEVLQLGMRRGLPDPRALLRLARIIRARRPDILHAHMNHAVLLGRLVRLLAPVPRLVSTFHTNRFGGLGLRSALKLSAGLSDWSTGVSESVVREAVRAGAVRLERIGCLHNGIDTQRFRPDAQARPRVRTELGLGGSFVWLAAGRLSESKDYPTLLRAFAALAGAAIDGEPTAPRLLIAGEGPLRPQLESLAGRLGLGTQVSFLGRRDDLPALMNACDGFVLSSAWEGFGMVLAEAMACARPVVATDCGGTRDILDGEAAARLVPPGDAVGLAAAMRLTMQADPSERAARGETNRELVAMRFGMQAVTDRWVELYEGLT